MSSHTETIKCPECEKVQEAVVEHAEPWEPWDIYVHTCTGCGYVIMESEWNKVQTSKPL